MEVGESMSYTHIVEAYYDRADGKVGKANFLARNLVKTGDGVSFWATNERLEEVNRFIPNSRIIEIRKIENGEQNEEG